MISRLLFPVAACLFNLTISQAQSVSLKTVTLPSPNASSLGKYGEMPVSLYSGIPQVSVPLYTIKTRDLELPISLNYHAGGIRLEEIPSNVGCGWSLNIGGVITRSIRGLPDIYLGGAGYDIYALMTTIAKKYPFNNLARNQVDAGNCLQEDVAEAVNVSKSIDDGQPDLYYFNFGKYSGSFFLGESGQFIISPKEGIKIENKYISIYSAQDIAQWMLTTPDGVKYVFGVSKDETRTALEKNANGQPREPITSWYLLDIISPFSPDQIQLTYTNLNYSYQTRAGETLNQRIGSQAGGNGVILPSRETRTTTNYITEPRISSISFPTGKVIVTSTNDRSDLPGCKSVDQISVYNYESLTRPLNKFNFTYDYSLGSRLTLKNVEEFSGFSTSAGNKYSFAYNTSEVLPSRDINGSLINSQDLWGFYNGITNASLPPSYSFTVDGVVKYFNGADRHADATKMKAGILTSITYPTSGKTEFEFEANTVYSNQQYDGIPFVPESKSVALNYVTGETKTMDFMIANAENGKAKVQINSHSQIAGCPIAPYSGISICNNAYIEGINGTSFFRYIPEGISSVDLPNGSYRLIGQGVVVGGQPSNVFYLKLDWYEYPGLGTPTPSNKTIGGLRIVRIRNTDGSGNVISLKKYLYSQLDDNTKSSGVLVNFPAPLFNYYFSVGYVSDPGGPIPDTYVRELYAQIKSVPLVPLSPTGGATIGYENVTELQGENGENGKTEYTFSTAKDSRDFFSYYRPFPPPISYDFRRGKLKLETVYKNTSGTFTPVRSTSNNYAVGLNSETGYGISVDNQNINVVLSPTVSFINYSTYFYVSENELISEQLYLNKQTTRIYSQTNPTEYVETAKDFQYDLTKGHYQLVKTTTTDSKNQVVESNLKYPQDIILTGNAETARQLMVTNHIWDAVLQQATLTNTIQTTQTSNYYKIFGNGFPLPESIETKTGTLSPEKRIEFLKYDSYGNILQQHKLKDNVNFVIWDYKNTYPIADAMNASDTRIDSIAYTSFEADGKGNWTFTGNPVADASAPTGKKCYYLGSPITKPGLSTSLTYIVSYWKKGGTVSVNGTTAVSGATVRGWTYYEHKVVNPAGGLITVSGTTAFIDELRLYPVDAKMMTYTYKPLVGITSQCDPNNRITYYEYDNFNRLYLARDQNYNILKRYVYNYSGQTENTTLVFNEPRSGGYIGACTGCTLGSTIYYTVPAGVYLAPTLAEANQLAQEDVAANGQAYANAVAPCITPGNPAIDGSNAMPVSFTVQFHNNNSNCTPVDYNFVINAGASHVNLGTVKEGNYNVTFSAGTNPSGYTYRVNGLTLHAVGGTISNVNISSSASNQVVISP